MIMTLFYKFIENIYLKIPNNLVYFDQLTSLHNRNYYNMVIKKKYNGRECDVVFVDANGLKHINDTCGHHAGSRFLQELADILSVCKCDEIWRYGGDEFIMVFDNGIELEDIEWLDENSYLLSWGMASKEAYEDMSNVIGRADEKMYEMKKKFHEKDLTN